MLATLAGLPADPSGWSFEFKWDGVRCLARWDGSRLALESRAGNPITARYPEIASIGAALAGTAPLLLDGEIVALDQHGRPSFGRLQRRMHLQGTAARAAAARTPVQFFAFDLLYADGASLLDCPYSTRREALARHAPVHPHLHVPPAEAGAGRAMLQVARAHGLEGIVAKRLDSPYEPGRRAATWRKVKLVSAQEMVIGGWMPSGTGRGRIASLLLGVYDDDGRLRCVGRVGTGFTQADRERLHQRLSALERPTSPFADAPGRPGRTAGARFVEPELVAQIAYRRWPEQGRVQQAAFQGLRTDVPAADVVRERPGGAASLREHTADD
jgi:bifunctional non-homologous end joining protein LigD